MVHPARLLTFILLCALALTAYTAPRQGSSLTVGTPGSKSVFPSGLGIGDAGVYPTPSSGPYAYSDLSSECPGVPASRPGLHRPDLRHVYHAHH